MQIGVNQAIVVQQLSFLLSIKTSGVMRNGEHWIWNTYEKWRADHFPFWSVATIQRVFEWLESAGVVISGQFDGYASRKKYYRLSLGALEKLTMENAEEMPNASICDDGASIVSKCDDGTSQVAMMDRSKLLPSLTESSSENSQKVQKKPSKGKKVIPQQLPPKTPIHSAALPSSAVPSDAGLEDADRFRLLLPDDFHVPKGWKESWAIAFDALAADGRNDDEVMEVCRWALSDSFWSRHFFTPVELRKVTKGVQLYDKLRGGMLAARRKKSSAPLSLS